MPIMVQIRNVPEVLHRRLKARAVLSGMSLSDYLLEEIRAYVALVEGLEAPLLTRDARLAGASGHSAKIILA
ncbi:MAG: hypothetical protein ABL883_09920 [Terricaulis sp.]